MPCAPPPFTEVAPGQGLRADAVSWSAPSRGVCLPEPPPPRDRLSGVPAMLIVATGAQPVFIKIGDGTPTAANTDPQMPANWTEYFEVTARSKSGGVISITELTN